MKKWFSGLAVLLSVGVTVSLVGCSLTQPAASQANYTNDNKIPFGSSVELGGAASVERQGDVKDSPYYKCPDFYNMKSTDTLTLLENFKTYQQTTEWTCGPASALMVMEWYGKRNGADDVDLVKYRPNTNPGATDLQEMINIFNGFGDATGQKWDLYSTYDLADPATVPETMILDTLKKGEPVIIGWDEWGGHWQVIIGYDTMGTDTTADDVLVLADPYDTTDHNQDGYVIQSYERLYWNWLNSFDNTFSKNLFLVPTPAQ